MEACGILIDESSEDTSELRKEDMRRLPAIFLREVVEMREREVEVRRRRAVEKGIEARVA